MVPWRCGLGPARLRGSPPAASTGVVVSEGEETGGYWIGKEKMEDVEEVVRAHALALSIARQLGPRPVQFYRMACPPLWAPQQSASRSLFPSLCA